MASSAGDLAAATAGRAGLLPGELERAARAVERFLQSDPNRTLAGAAPAATGRKLPTKDEAARPRRRVGCRSEEDEGDRPNRPTDRSSGQVTEKSAKPKKNWRKTRRQEASAEADRTKADQPKSARKPPHKPIPTPRFR